MEWNAKSPSQWDWEYLSSFNPKAAENPKLQPPNTSAEAKREINAGMLDTSGGSGCSGSELMHASSSRSSKSTSISSSNRDSKTSTFTFESSQDDSNGKKELSKEEPVETSHAPEPSSVSGEQLLTLKLGKRLYFEDVYPGSDSKNISFSGAPVSSLNIGKKCKSNGQNIHYRCQVEGCGLDLSSAKDYHRKHRVCESHSKCPKVVIAGLERRFCQQCSRFHGLLEFDEKKRSCRRRLSDHNARRRKPYPQAAQLSQSTLSSPHFDGRQPMSPFSYSRTASNVAWHDIHIGKLHHTKDFLMKPAKADNEMPNIFSVLSDDSNIYSASKGLATKSINPDIEDSITSDANATQDFHRALSLLSINSWGSYETKPFSLEQPNHTTSTTTHHPMINAMSPRFPPASSEFWHTDQQENSSAAWLSFSNSDDGNRFHEFPLFKETYESGFPYDPLG